MGFIYSYKYQESKIKHSPSFNCDALTLRAFVEYFMYFKSSDILSKPSTNAAKLVNDVAFAIWANSSDIIFALSFKTLTKDWSSSSKLVVNRVLICESVLFM